MKGNLSSSPVTNQKVASTAGDACKASTHHIVTGYKERVRYKSFAVPDQALLIALSYHSL
jgi:hypothetical protein